MLQIISRSAFLPILHLHDFYNILTFPYKKMFLNQWFASNRHSFQVMYSIRNVFNWIERKYTQYPNISYPKVLLKIAIWSWLIMSLYLFFPEMCSWLLQRRQWVFPGSLCALWVQRSGWWVWRQDREVQGKKHTTLKSWFMTTGVQNTDTIDVIQEVDLVYVTAPIFAPFWSLELGLLAITFMLFSYQKCCTNNHAIRN